MGRSPQPPRCPGCNTLLSEHWQCAVCRCLGHAEIVSKRDKAICASCERALERRNARRCKTCRVVKALDKFGITRGVYRRRECKACQRKDDRYRAWQRAWAARNRERLRAKNRERYHRYYSARRKALHRASYRRNRAKRLETQARYRVSERGRLNRRRWLAQNGERMQYYRARRKLAILRGGRA